jgi:hypothetical protein
MGFPIGGSSREFTYFYLQTHYSNPSVTSGKCNKNLFELKLVFFLGLTDATSVTFVTTTNYRSIEIGMFTVGLQANPEAIVVPPAQTTYSLSMTCQSDCMNVILLFFSSC